MKKPRPVPNATRVVAYTRVSSLDQAEHGVSLADQKHRLECHAAAHGLEIVRFEADEGLSGKRADNRPALQRALDSLKAGEATGLLTTKLDRLSRSIRDIIALVERSDREGWRLVSLAESLDTGSAMGRFTVHLFGALAELERAQISERTRHAMAHLRREGKRTSSRPPFGFEHVDGRAVPVESEQEILRRMLALREAGLGGHRIAETLNAEGPGNPRTGRPWHYGTVRAIIRSAARRCFDR